MFTTPGRYIVSPSRTKTYGRNACRDLSARCGLGCPSPGKGLMSKRSTLLLGPGLLTTEGPQHRKQRKMLTSVFSTAHLRNATPLFYETSYKVCLVVPYPIYHVLTTFTAAGRHFERRPRWPQGNRYSSVDGSNGAGTHRTRCSRTLL